jgi:hypothetical protein
METGRKTDFVSIVAREISSGIDRALAYWLGRIELGLVDANFTTAQRMAAIEAIVREYKQSSCGDELGLASA